MHSHLFPPSVGGVETVAWLLARQWVREGHEVDVTTATPGAWECKGVRVHRRVPAPALLGLLRRADVWLHNQVSLKMAPALLAIRRPWVVASHYWIGRTGPKARIKRLLLRLASTRVSVSAALAADLDVPSEIIGNPYDEETFFEAQGAERDLDLVFLGRLVSEKGTDLLLPLLDELAGRGLHPALTVVGEGPELGALRRAAAAGDAGRSVRFLGLLGGDALRMELNRHRVMLIPSSRESFGLAALEGIACGCVPVGTRTGGLPEAIGACGETVETRSAAAFADRLVPMLSGRCPLDVYRANAGVHLALHRPDAIARRYLEVLERVVKRRRRHRVP